MIIEGETVSMTVDELQAHDNEIIERCADIVEVKFSKHGFNYYFPSVGREMAYDLRNLKTEEGEKK